ncbi:MAG: nucleotidyltransferase family protein [Bacillus subtilis]|nr:nucleotidyltransferase family protein [Bacillus subtilis]
MITGIVLAGGFSSRAGQNKMGFIYRGQPLIRHTVQTLAPFVVSTIVVTGHYDAEVRAILQDIPNLQFVYNPIYEQGMFSSVLAGVHRAEGDVFLVPGDCPNISALTYETIVSAHGHVRVPVYHGRKGHPLFLSESIVRELRAEPVASNLKAFRDRHFVTTVEVEDPGVLIDIDTLEDFAAHNQRREGAL